MARSGSPQHRDPPQVEKRLKGADNNASERDLRPIATYRKVTGGSRAPWVADLFTAFYSIVGIAPYQTVTMPLSGQSVLIPVGQSLGITHCRISTERLAPSAGQRTAPDSKLLTA